MSVAQVLTMSGLQAQPPPGAELPPEMDKILAETKALDGLEHIYVLGNNSGEGQTILVWRDQEAMQAAHDHIAADNVTVGNLMGSTLSFGPVYSNFTEL